MLVICPNLTPNNISMSQKIYMLFLRFSFSLIILSYARDVKKQNTKSSFNE